MKRALWWTGVSIALLLAGGAVLFVIQGAAWHRKFEAWLTARPIDLDVDLSVPGTFVGALDQTCSIAHAELFEVVMDAASAAAATDPRVLQGLEATLRIEDSGGREVASQTFPPDSLVLGPLSDQVVVFRVIPFATGRYRLMLNVTSGAPALAGSKQRLVARYELCGLERLPGTVAYWLSAGCALVTVVLAGTLAATFGAVRQRRQNSVSVPVAAASGA